MTVLLASHVGLWEGLIVELGLLGTRLLRKFGIYCLVLQAQRACGAGNARQGIYGQRRNCFEIKKIIKNCQKHKITKFFSTSKAKISQISTHTNTSGVSTRQLHQKFSPLTLT